MKQTILVCIAVCLISLTGCGGGGHKGLSPNQSGSVLIRMPVPEATTRSIEDIGSAKVWVTGQEILEPIIKDLQYNADNHAWEVQFEVPSGIDRVFEVQAKDKAGNPLYLGKTVSDIKPAEINLITVDLFLDPTPPSDFFTDPSAVQSPHGSVPFGEKAYSPDGTRYACEVEPQSYGNIGIFQVSDNQLLITIKTLPGIATNYLKGLAWSRDSKYIAVMYHGGILPGINLYDVQSGSLVRYIGPGSNLVPGSNSYGFYHYMIFSRDNAWIYVSFGQEIDNQYPSGITATASTFKQFSGANLPWINYGWDIGRNPWGGAHGGFSSNLARLNSDFAFLAQNGVKIIRVFIFCDLRSGILFDAQGMPTGFDQYGPVGE